MRPRRTPPRETSPDVAQELADELRAAFLADVAVRSDGPDPILVARIPFGAGRLALAVGGIHWAVVLYDTRSVVRTEMGSGDMTAAALAAVVRRVLKLPLA